MSDIKKNRTRKNLYVLPCPAYFYMPAVTTYAKGNFSPLHAVFPYARNERTIFEMVPPSA